MNCFRLILSLLPVTFIGYGQEPKQSGLAQPRINGAEVQFIVGMARGSPPEFAADALLTLIEAGLLNRRAQQDLLLEAFAMAGDAQEPVALHEVDGGIVRGSAYAFEKNLDQVSLRARSVRALLKLDPKEARRLFQRIELPMDQTFDCEQALSFDLSLYYSMMSQVLDSTTLPREREELLWSHLARFKSVAQIAPLSDVLARVPGGPAGFPSVVVTFAAMLPMLKKDRRIFSSDFVASLVALQKLAAAVPPSTREYLIQQTRLWILEGVNYGVCAHRKMFITTQDGKNASVPWTGAADLFNLRLAGLSLVSPPPVIESRDIKDAPQFPPALIERRSSEYEKYRRLYYLLSREGEEAQDSPRWKSEMEKCITVLIEWKGDGQDQRQHYLEKAELLDMALRTQKYYIKPGGSPPEAVRERDKLHGPPAAEILGRDRLMVATAHFFEGELAQEVFRTRRIVWFTPVYKALRGPKSHTLQFADLFATSSRQPVLNLYGRLTKLLAENGKY